MANKQSKKEAQALLVEQAEQEALARARTEQNEAEFKRYRDEVWKTVSDNHDSFDKQVLTLSSAFLGFSLTFMKDIVRLDTAELLLVLYISWCFFAASVLVTMISFVISTQAVDYHLKLTQVSHREVTHL